MRDFWLRSGLSLSRARTVLGLYMLVSGTLRIITGNTPAMVNVFSSRVYGALLVLGAIWLLATASDKYRCRWLGRWAAIYAASLWLLIIGSTWSAGAWVSICGACVFVVALANEVRAHEC